MAKMVKPLTVTQINNAKPSEKKTYLSDGGGLRLLVYPNGTKSWLFNYIKPYLNKRTEISLGKYPALSLQAAREKAAEYRGYLAQKLDPQTVEADKAEIERRKRADTFGFVANEWLAYRAKIGKEKGDYSEKTRLDTERRVGSAVAILGDVPFTQLTLKHGLAVLEPLRQAGALFELRKRYFVLKKIGEYAERFGYWQQNAWRYLGEDLPLPDKTRHHAAIHYRDLPALLKSLCRANVSYSVKLAILWGLLNVTRASETVSAHIEMFNEIEGMTVWEVVVNKGGKGTRRHQIPLSRQALALFKQAKQHTKNGWLFPSPQRGGKYPYVNPQTPNDVLKTMDGGKFNSSMTNHGIRTLFSSYCNDNRLELGLDKEVIEICLSHLNGDEVRNAYNRAEYLPYRLKTFQAWADYVEQCAGGLFDEIICDNC